TKIWQVYADAIHMNNIGSYILACTYYATLYKDSPVGIGVPSQYGAIDNALANSIQQTVWEVVSNHPFAGISTAGIVAVTGVTLSETNTAVAVNQNFQLTATIAPTNATNQSTTWSSSNSSVATVSSTGVIKGVSAGNATITATTTDGSFVANCLVNVSTSNIPVTSIAVLPTTLSVKVGNSSTLAATVSPNNATITSVNWSSSNDAIVSVDANGKVTAVSAGNATITATTQSDNKTATCAFTSLANAAPTAVITATPITGTSPLVVNFSSAGSADADAGDFILGYEWDFGDGSAIDKSATPSHTYINGGTFIVKLKVMDNNNLFGEQVTKTITVIQGTSSNIAVTGTGVTWDNIPADNSLSDESKSDNNLVNNGNITESFGLNDVSTADNWQAAGTIWTQTQNGITSVKYYNGTTNSVMYENGIFTAGIKLQSSTDGTTWKDVSDWTISPAYTYDLQVSNQIYTFSGEALNNVMGIRIIGQVRSKAVEMTTSWSIKLKEVEVIKTVSTTPVNLKSFDAKVIGNKAKINWSTALEINNKYFELEKSTNGINFSLLAKVPAKGSNSSYTIDDVAPSNGVNYYRLTQYDLNGDFKNLGIRQVTFGLTNNEISVYPIPNNGDLYIDLNNFGAKQVKVSISNLNGKIVYSQDLLNTLNTNKYKLNLKQKPNPGIYMLQITAPGLYKTYKVVFQ
ncbi:MAG: T9SS C-terminal target domain-containing protein, partial [Sphingobacteriales bacterium]